MSNVQLSSVNTVQGPRLQTGVRRTANSQAQAPDRFERQEFNLDSAMETLSAIKTQKNGREVPKFGNVELNVIKTALNRTPEKWESIQKLATTSFVRSRVVTNLATENKDILDAMVPYVIEPSVRPTKGKYRTSELEMLMDVGRRVGSDKLKEAQPLIRTALSGENIAVIASTPALYGRMNQVTEKVVDMQRAMGANLKQLVFNGNLYNKEEFVVQAATRDNQINTELLDKDLKRSAVENMTLYQEADGTIYQIKKVNDLKNNSVSKVRLELDDQDMPYVTNEVRVFKDKNGNVLRKEYTSQSEIPGIFDIKHVDANGKETIISSGKKDPRTGVVSIKKEMKSLDGTRTSYLYENDPEGNSISDYKIVDKNGKVLLNNSKTFEVLGENHFISSKNKEKYEIKMDNHNITVVDMNKPERTATISIDRKIRGNKQEILKSLKQMPGEELFKVAQTTKKLVGTNAPLDSYYDPSDKSIHSGDNLFIVLHELGHATDMKDVDCTSDASYDRTVVNSISENEEVQKVYDEERKAFNAAFPDTQRDYIDYFINKATHYGGELGGLVETIAESNALLTTPKTFDFAGIRSHYLQQYFPRTIALLDKVLSEKIA